MSHTRNRLLCLFAMVACACGPTQEAPDAGASSDSGEPDAGRQQYEISYDDGTCEGHSSPWGTQAGSQIAVKFTPDRYPAKIVDAWFHVPRVAQYSTEFGVRLYEGGGPNGGPGDLIAEFSATGAQGDLSPWAIVTAQEDLPEIEAGDFFVSMLWLTAPGDVGGDAQFLCMDMDEPDRRTWWRFLSTGMWQRAETVGTQGDQDAMIRVTVQ